MRHTALAAGFLAIALPACATLGTSALEKRAEQRLQAGLAALDRGDYETASREIGFVAENHRAEPVGRQALLAAAAVEMDPRNPRQRLQLGVELTGHYLQAQLAEPPWLEPVARTLYLLALELGGAEERAAQAEAEKAVAEQKAEQVVRQLPRLPNASVASQLRETKDERDRLNKKVTQLEAQLADREKKLAESEKELERIRKTLKS